jgi:hypothetical protein
MVGTILKEMARFLSIALITGAEESDPTRCAVVKVGALQDDPTRTNAWCTIQHDPEKGSVPGWGEHESTRNILAEIGPINERWTHNFVVEAGIYTDSLENVTFYIDTLGARVYAALMDNYTLNGITLSVGTRMHRIVSPEATIITNYTTSITGGERDWFGRVKIAVHYHAEVS